MINNGYIKLHRQMMEWEWYTDIPVKVLFLHILLKANHAEGRWKGEEIQRGQTVTSIRHLATREDCSKQTRKNWRINTQNNKQKHFDKR